MEKQSVEFWVTDGEHTYGKGNCHKPYCTYKSASLKATRFNNHSIRRGRPERYFVATWVLGDLVKWEKAQ